MRARRSGVRALVLAMALSSAATVAGATGTVNVEIDWMEDATHSHKPQPDEIAAVVQMFACHGITLNVVVDQAIPEQQYIVDGPDPKDFFTATGPGTYNAIKAAYFNHFTFPGWHYCVFAHEYYEDKPPNGSSGIALRPGFDLIVTLGRFANGIGTPFDRAAGFAHELGHNLGLDHGGSKSPVDIGPYPPVYASIMSYLYQMAGVRTHMMCLGLTGPYNLFKDLDYSNGRLPDVNEGSLDEAVGLGMMPVDWDCNGSIGGVVAKDLNDVDNNGRWCEPTNPPSPPNQDLGDWNDWTTVQLFVTTPALMKLPPQHEACISAREQQLLRPLAASDCAIAQPQLVTEACIGAGQMMWVNPAYGGVESGTGNQPYRTLSAAYAAAPDGSIFYLRPGSCSAGTAVMSRPAIFTGPGVVTLVP